MCEVQYSFCFTDSSETHNRQTVLHVEIKCLILCEMGREVQERQEKTDEGPYVSYVGRDNSVGIAIRCGLGGPGFEYRGGDIFRTRPARPGPGEHQANGHRVTALTTHHHLEPKLKKVWSYTSTPPLGLHRVKLPFHRVQRSSNTPNNTACRGHVPNLFNIGLEKYFVLSFVSLLRSLPISTTFGMRSLHTKQFALREFH